MNKLRFVINFAYCVCILLIAFEILENIFVKLNLMCAKYLFFNGSTPCLNYYIIENLLYVLLLRS